MNKYINHIYLLNERTYTYGEMGITPKYKSLADKKIVQIIINKRLTYTNAFQKMEYIQNVIRKGEPAYFIVSNSDMFYNFSISNIVKFINPHLKSSICLGRYEYNPRIIDLKKCPVNHLTKTGCSQDTWIFYGGHLPKINTKYSKQCDFQLGQIRCDNRIAFILKDMGLTPVNPMKYVQSYHYHSSGFRTYNRNNQILGAIHLIKPIL